MKKFICLLIIFVFTGCAAQSVTLSGGVSYTVNEARQIAFDGVAQKIDMSKYKEYFVDKNFEKNQELLKKGKKRYKDRYLTKFSDGAYSISYRNNTATCFYYDKSGKLVFIDLIENRDYPKKAVTYNRLGELDSTCLFVSGKEQYIFDTNKKLGAHWIGKNCYNEKGQLVLTREY